MSYPLLSWQDIRCLMMDKMQGIYKKKKAPRIVQLKDKLNDYAVFAKEQFANMGFLRVKVTDYISNGFPGFVRTEFSDIKGNLYTIEEKVPVLSDRN